MYFKQWNRILSVICAAALSMSCMATLPAAATPINLVSNSTFDSGTSGWGKYQESGGSASLSTENGQLALSVSSVGELNYSVQCYYDIVPLYKNGVYHIQYDISSTIDRTIEGMIQQNGGTYQSYSWKQIDLTSTPQTVDYTFTMKKDTDVMAKLVFNCGTQGKICRRIKSTWIM